MNDINATELAFYHEHGYLILPGFLRGHTLPNDIMHEVDQLGRLYDPDFVFAEAASSVKAFSPQARQNFYRALRYLPAVTAIAASPALTMLSRRFGLKQPAVMRSYNMRMDVPHETQHLFHWHQDISYLLGSLNSITYWLPLSRSDAEHGSIAVIAGSHNRGAFAVIHTGEGTPPAHLPLSPSHLRLVNEPGNEGIVIEADRGDLVLFSQFILHRSVPNHGNEIRWTVQARHSDLAEPAFIDAGYPFGDATNLFHNRYLEQKAIA